VKATERWTRGDGCLIGGAVLSLVYMSKHGSNLILDNSGVAETMKCAFEREGTQKPLLSRNTVISYPPVLHSPPKFHAESTDHCVVVVRAFLPRCCKLGLLALDIF
jgi:hypothetical protein